MRKYLKEAIVFFITWLIALGTRLVYIQLGDMKAISSRNFYQEACNSEGLYQMKQWSIGEFYTKLLSGVMLFVGDGLESVVYLNVILQIFSVILVYVAIRRWASCYISAVVTLIIASVPMVIEYIMECSLTHLYVFLASVAICIVSIIASLGVRKATTKKADEADTLEGETVAEEQTATLDIVTEKSDKRASQSIYGEMKEITFEDIEEREKAAIRFIENPLPVPKRRVHKEMDYAIQVSDDADYDLQDMTGRDFFDIE